MLFNRYQINLFKLLTCSKGVSFCSLFPDFPCAFSKFLIKLRIYTSTLSNVLGKSNVLQLLCIYITRHMHFVIAFIKHCVTKILISNSFADLCSYELHEKNRIKWAYTDLQSVSKQMGVILCLSFKY